MGERKGMNTKLGLNSRALLGCKLPARCAESRFEESELGGTRWPDPARPRDEDGGKDCGVGKRERGP